jgi:aminotransferase
MRSFISNRVQQIPPSGIRRFFDIAATMDDVISLGIGEPDFVTPEAILEAGIASLRAGHTHYTSNNGTIELRTAVSKHLKKLYDVEYDPALEILITVGVSEAMYLALTAILNPGDEVIVPQPCFVSYAAEVSLAGGTPVPIATRVENDFQVTAEEIEAAITHHTKALLIGYPNNPTGAVLERATLEAIARVAQKHDILVISDEIYDRLVYGIDHVCFASLPDMWERTILLGGFSKSYAMTGWRLGYAAAPPEILGGMRKIHQFTVMSAPTIAQEAGITALEQAEAAIEEMRQRYDRRRRLIVDGLNSIGLKCFEPRGAFYAFPSVRGSGMDDAEFAERLLNEGRVAVVPGRAFGIGGAGYVRCSYATAYAKIEQALERLANFVRKYG